MAWRLLIGICCSLDRKYAFNFWNCSDVFTLFVPFIIFDNPQIGIFGAIKQSIILVIDNIKTMLLFYLIISVCGALLLSTFIGTLLLLTCIGIIVALPLMYLIIAVTFLKLKGDNNANNIIPPTSNIS